MTFAGKCARFAEHFHKTPGLFLVTLNYFNNAKPVKTTLAKCVELNSEDLSLPARNEQKIGKLQFFAH